ncbi:MAG: YfhO family protein [Oscillospiraceae bacterium]|nr:YfhO family protein [Oscillospiraceae bacterium]
MKLMSKSTITSTQVLKLIILVVVFLSLTCLLYLGFRQDKQLMLEIQKVVFPLGMGALLAGIATLLLNTQMDDTRPTPKKWWFYPLISSLLGLACMSLAYAYLGVWPVGERSVMIVDMHHQYAPLLAQLRDMLKNGGSPFYSFDIGLGASFIPLFGYYLASPFNIILAFFPKEMLNEGILVITLLKNALTAGFFALCVQYVYRRRNISIIIVSIMYSMMMYLLAYSWNIMWLDCVMVLPLIVMGFERLMRTGRYLIYVLSLAYALYSNYYIGFMVCVFMVLYFICSTIRQRNASSSLGVRFGRFIIGSGLGGGLAMFLLLPVYFSLAQTSASGGTLPDMTNNFNMLELFGRHLFETSPTIRSGNLPNIYCGLLSVLLLPIFATMKSISLRRRIAYLGLLGVLALSLVLNQLDLIWHGLHAPNDLPYRFSFLYSFVLILIAYETLLHIKNIRFVQIGGSVAGIIGLIMLREHFGGDDYDFNTIYISLLLIIAFATVLGLVSRKNITPRPAYNLLLLIVTVEMVFNGGSSFKTMQSNEYFTARDDYVANDITKALSKAVERTEQIGDSAVKGAFYRMEFLPRRTTVDTAMFDYRGMTVFASSSPKNLTEFLGFIGYAGNGVNSHLYKSFVPMVDSLLGIKYIILDSARSSELSNDPYLKYLEQIKYQDQIYTIYENTKALPLGYFVESSISDWNPSKYAPFTSQNDLYARLTGKRADLYTLAPVTVESGNEDVSSITGTFSFTINAAESGSTGNFVASVEKPGQTYTFIDCRAADSIRISTSAGSWDVSAHEPFIVNTGLLNEGDELRVTVTSKSSCSGNIYVGTLDQQAFESAYDFMSANAMTVTDFTDTQVKGFITAPKNGVVFTSIPYDEGWKVRVNGNEVKSFAACDAMLAFRVDAGRHNIEIEFHTIGFVPGLLISLGSLALLILLVIFIRKKVDPCNPSDNEFAAFSRMVFPQKTVAPAVDPVDYYDLKSTNTEIQVQPGEEDETPAVDELPPTGQEKEESES